MATEDLSITIPVTLKKQLEENAAKEGVTLREYFEMLLFPHVPRSIAVTAREAIERAAAMPPEKRGSRMIHELTVSTGGQGLHEITREVRDAVSASGVRDGLCTVFIRHTSASLTIQENADPSARRDLEAWLNRLVPENDPLYTHTSEGPDDMPSHIKAILTQVSVSIPVSGGELVLGMWQGIYVWEHRRGSHRRKVVVHVG